MRDSLDGRAAIVTGASAGIGWETAHALAREGASVALAARREDRLRELAAELDDRHGAETLVVPTDVRDETAVTSLVDETVDAFGGLDVLVNNAGLARGSAVESMPTEEFDLMQETNVDGVFYATRAALSHLRERDGHLVFVGSFAGKFPRPYNPVYAATKYWVRGFAHSVAAQVGDEGVAVSVVNPGQTRTEFEVAGEAFEERYDPGEATEPDEIAEAIAFVVKQHPSTVAELDLYTRDKFTHF